MITDKQIRLRSFEEKDIPQLLEWFQGAGEEEVLTWSGRNFRAPLDAIQLKNFLKREVDGGLSRFFAIEAEHEMAGVIGLLRIDRINLSGRLGLVLVGKKALRGKGIASRAVKKVLDIGFNNIGLHKITLGVFDYNAPAIRCYTKIGFHFDGLLRDHFAVGEKYHNLMELSILSSEWEEKKHDKTGALGSKTVIELERFTLRKFTITDVQAAFNFYTSNKKFHKKWSPVRESEFYTLKGQMENLRREIFFDQNGRSLRLWLVANEQTGFAESGIPLGNIGLSQIVRGHFQSAFLGYQMDRRFINRGLVTEALKSVLNIAYNDLNLHRLEANVMPANTPSRSVMDKLGFREEGVAKNYLRINGKWEDHIHYIMLKEDWNSRPKTDRKGASV